PVFPTRNGSATQASALHRSRPHSPREQALARTSRHTLPFVIGWRKGGALESAEKRVGAAAKRHANRCGRSPPWSAQLAAAFCPASLLAGVSPATILSTLHLAFRCTVSSQRAGWGGKAATSCRTQSFAPLARKDALFRSL